MARSQTTERLPTETCFPDLADHIRGEIRKELTVHVDDGEVSARDNHALAHDQSETSGTSGDNTDSALEGKGSQGPLHVLAAAALDEFGRRKFVILRILDRDRVVSSSKGSGSCV